MGAGQPQIDHSGQGARAIRELSEQDLQAAGVRITGSGVIQP